MSGLRQELQYEQFVTMSIRWPKNVFEKIDAQRGPYLSRNMAILKLVRERLEEEQNDSRK